MSFSNRLAFLIEITGVKNVALARALRIDASQISRLKRGSRKAPHKTELVGRMADFFAARMTSDYQLSALAEKTNDMQLRVTQSPAYIRDAIIAYLSSEEAAQPSLAVIQTLAIASEARSAARPTEIADAELGALVFYGNEGKRRAMLSLLSRMARAQTGAMMISSDESTDWLTEDRTYFDKVKGQLLWFTWKNTVIQRIIPPMLSLNDALTSFSLWLPLYLTGSVCPYHLPKLRDGLYRRTLMIAPGAGALVSTSIGWQKESGMTCLFSDEDIVKHYEREFIRYRDLCQPALTILDPVSQRDALYARILAYYQRAGASIRGCKSLSFISLPREYRERTSDSALFLFFRSHGESADAIGERAMFAQPITDIIHLSSAAEVRAGKASYCHDEARKYSPAEYAAHLHNMIRLLETYDQYTVVIANRYPLGCTIYAKKEMGAMLFTSGAPNKVLDIIAPNTFQAIWDSLERIADVGVSASANKRRVIAELKRVIGQLEDDT